MQLQAADRRSAKRIDVAIESRLLHKGMQLERIVIDNLSFTGFGATCEAELKQGDRVSIDLPRLGLVRASVAWTRGGNIGGMFDKPVDVRRCMFFDEVTLELMPD